MSNITELRKYKESKEFKNIIKQCKNREENTAGKILDIYRDWVPANSTNCIYSNHDMNANRMAFTIKRLEEIKSTSEWAKLLKEELLSEIDRTEKFLTLWIRDQYGITNSSQIFDSIDLLRGKVQDNRYFQNQLDWMISALEKEEEKEDPVYEEAKTD